MDQDNLQKMPALELRVRVDNHPSSNVRKELISLLDNIFEASCANGLGGAKILSDDKYSISIGVALRNRLGTEEVENLIRGIQAMLLRCWIKSPLHNDRGDFGSCLIMVSLHSSDETKFSRCLSPIPVGISCQAMESKYRDLGMTVGEEILSLISEKWGKGGLLSQIDSEPICASTIIQDRQIDTLISRILQSGNFEGFAIEISHELRNFTFTISREGGSGFRLTLVESPPLDCYDEIYKDLSLANFAKGVLGKISHKLAFIQAS